MPRTAGTGFSAGRALFCSRAHATHGPKALAKDLPAILDSDDRAHAGQYLPGRFWALLYRALGAFEDFETAMYFSGVTFTSLGYGDVVLDGRIRLLGPLQAANGLMMFGITTALFFSAIQHATGKLTAANRTAHEP